MPQRMLYFLVPGTNISPFDVTIAADAGFDQVIPLTNIRARDVPGLVQDAIFCRPPNRYNDTGIFIGGRDVHIATDMYQAAAKAMVGEFQVGLFADPNGAYTTSASVVALVDDWLSTRHCAGIAGRRVAVFGPGPVGLCTAVLAAKQGAKVTLCQLTIDDNERVAQRFGERFGVEFKWAAAESPRDRHSIVAAQEVVISTARAGVRILEKEHLAVSSGLLLTADTNAVPPSGIEGIELQDDGAHPADRLWASIGALAIGALKYKTQLGLFQAIQTSATPARFDFTEALHFARAELASHRKTVLAA